MSIHLESRDLLNTQQMEVAVNGPDGATHLILCTGIANLDFASHETYTFFVGPQLSRRQFVGAIASGALSRIRTCDNNHARDVADVKWEINLVSIYANYDDEVNRVKVRAEISSSDAMTELAISYDVSILAELTMY